MRFPTFWQAVLNNEDNAEWWHGFDMQVSADDYDCTPELYASSHWRPASLKIVLLDRVETRQIKLKSRF